MDCPLRSIYKEYTKDSYIILYENPVYNKKALDIESSVCPIFYGFIEDIKFPVTYAPFSESSIDFPENNSKKCVLSLGDDTNFTIAYLNEKKIRISPNFGKLETIYKLDEMDKMIKAIIEKNNMKDITILKDFNNYSLVSNYSEKYPGIKKINHIYSHLAVTMYDNGFTKEKGIGVIYDNVSYGPAGQIQGSEFVYGRIGDYETIGRWRSVPLPGGDIANIEPWRISIAIIKEAIKGDITNLGIPLVEKVRENPHLKYIFDAINEGNTGYTLSSSMRHIISGLGELLWYKESTFNLEFFESLMSDAIVEDNSVDYYKVSLSEENELMLLDTYDFFRQVISDIFAKKEPEFIISQSITGIAKATGDMVEKISKKFKEKKVFLSGYIFLNTSILHAVYLELVSRGFKVFINKTIPIDNSAISVGQIIYNFYENKNR